MNGKGNATQTAVARTDRPRRSCARRSAAIWLPEQRPALWHTGLPRCDAGVDDIVLEESQRLRFGRRRG